MPAIMPVIIFRISGSAIIRARITGSAIIRMCIFIISFDESPIPGMFPPGMFIFEWSAAGIFIVSVFTAPAVVDAP
jgi:hypothetical protein